MYREALLNAKPGASMPEMKEFAAVLIRHQCSAIQDPVPMLCHSAQSSERPTLQVRETTHSRYYIVICRYLDRERETICAAGPITSDEVINITININVTVGY